jgi:hypothetical protein
MSEAMSVYLVIVDNDDTEPEIWAFESPINAHRFSKACKNSCYIRAIGVLDERTATVIGTSLWV